MAYDKRRQDYRQGTSMRANLEATLLVAVLCVLVPAAGAEEPEYAEEATTAPDDLTGWRLCPACGRLNRPEAEYCMYCGIDLAEKAAKPQRRTPFTISGEIPFSAQAGWFIAGVGCAYDAGVWGEELILMPFFLLIPVGAFNDFHVYVRQGELRPFVSALVGGYDLPEFEGGTDDDFFLTVGAAGGVRYNYDGRGSYLYGSGGLGYRRRGGESYEAREGPVLIFKTRFTHFFSEHIGLTGSVQGWNAEILASGGVALGL